MKQKSKNINGIRKILFFIAGSLFFMSMQAQVEITGTVADEKGETLIGVAVVEKGTGNGSIADVSGSFRISVSDANATLVFSYLGYVRLEVPINGRKNLNITLVEDNQILDEVIVVGYGVQKRIHLTGSVSQVNSKELLKAPMSNLSNVLTGKLPGLTSVQSSGIPGGDQSNLYVRGTSTFRDASPLILVDGVERMLNTVNPNDVESVTILKDAASAAVYGVRAANGVILITTKKGKEGKSTISYDGSVTFSLNTRFPEFLDGPDYIRWYDRARELDGMTRMFDADIQSKVINNYDPDGIFANTDWFDLLFKDYGLTQQHNVSMSGGSKDINYYTSVGYMGQDGIIDNVNYERYNVRSNIDGKVTDNLSFSLNLSGFYEKRDWPGISLGAGSYLNPISQAMFAAPIVSSVYTDGTPMGWLSEEGLAMNGKASVDNGGFQKRLRRQFEGQGRLEYAVPHIKGLKAAVNLAYYTSYTEDNNYLAAYDMMGVNPVSLTVSSTIAAGTSNGGFNKSASAGDGFTIRPSIQYNRTFAKHEMGALFLYERNIGTGSTMTGRKSGYYADSPIDISQGAVAAEIPITGSHSKSTTIGYVGRMNYAFDNKYLAEFAFRVDGSYKFRQEDRWGFFPTVSLGWNLSEESFFKDMFPKINLFKIRASAGELGNDDINAFLYKTTYEITSNYNYIFGSQPYYGYYTSNSIPSYVSWSKTRSYNIGLETNIWNGLLGVELDCFYKETRDILESVSSSYPPSLGGNFASIANTGKVDNRGIEIVLKHKNRIGSVNYDVVGNFAWSRNKVLSRQQSSGTPYARNAIGKPIGEVYGFRAIGLFQTQEQLDNRPTGPGGTQSLGDLMYDDVNGDGQITKDDFVKIADSSTPEINFSLTTNFSYHNFDISALWQGAAICDILLSHTSNSVFDNTMYTRPFYGGGNAPYYLVENAWTPENTNAKYPRLSTKWNGNNGWPSSWWVKDGSYLRLKNAQFGYTLPKSILTLLGIAKCRMYVAGTNLLTFSSFKYVDPEMVNVNNGYYPQQKTYSVGVNVTF